MILFKHLVVIKCVINVLMRGGGGFGKRMVIIMSLGYRINQLFVSLQ